MSEENIETVMNLSFCSRDEAILALQEVGNDPVEAITLLLKTPPTVGAPKEKEMNELQKFFAKLRTTTEELNKSIEAELDKSKKSGQHDSSSSIDLPSERATSMAISANSLAL